jgi:hypothetical protein
MAAVVLVAAVAGLLIPSQRRPRGAGGAAAGGAAAGGAAAAVEAAAVE